MAENLLASQYNDFYNRLNAIREKHRASNIPVNTISPNYPNLSSQMQTLQDSINTVKNNTDSHLKNAHIDTSIPNIAQYQTILLSTKTKINDILTQMYNVCHYYSSDYSGNDSNYSSCDSYSCNTDYTSNDSNYTSCDSYSCSYFSGNDSHHASCDSYSYAHNASNDSNYGRFE